MKRLAVVALFLAGCTEHGKTPDGGVIDAPIFFPDAPPFGDAFPPIDAPLGTNPGFTQPTTVVAAWTETSANTFSPATLDLSCLKAMRIDPSSTTTVTINATIHDFQSGNAVPNATVAAFTGNSVGNPFTTQMANGSAMATLTLPAGTKRFGYKLTGSSSVPTFHLDQLAGTTSPQSKTLEMLSTSTMQTLPALIAESATPGRTIAIGTMTDCQGHTLSGTIATISATPSMPSHLAGANTFYFSDSVRLPVRHSSAPATTKNGLFMIIEVPAASSAFIQVWGFKSAADQSQQILTELAELAVPVPSASALITTHDPRATN